jgi:hypothetical protein
MTAPAAITDLLTDLDTETTVTPLPAVQPGHAMVHMSDKTGEVYFIVSPVYERGEPRPLNCDKHGAQRHDWNGKHYVCKKCEEAK